MNADTMREALKSLDKLLDKELKLVIAGGAAMVLRYDFPIATHDIDAVPFQSHMEIGEVDKLARTVAQSFFPPIPSDWLNPYYESFSFVLPKDYGTRLKPVFSGKRLEVFALGPEDLLIMKCFARRDKDIPHIRFLLKKGLDTNKVTTHLESLIKRKIPRAQEALDFLDDILDYA